MILDWNELFWDFKVDDIELSGVQSAIEAAKSEGLFTSIKYGANNLLSAKYKAVEERCALQAPHDGFDRVPLKNLNLDLTHYGASLP